VVLLPLVVAEHLQISVALDAPSSRFSGEATRKRACLRSFRRLDSDLYELWYLLSLGQAVRGLHEEAVEQRDTRIILLMGSATVSRPGPKRHAVAGHRDLAAIPEPTVADRNHATR
jgi:hypothetical protein